MCLNCSLVSANWSLVSENHKLNKNYTGINLEINQTEQNNRKLQRLLLETETISKFSQVKPRLDKINQGINQDKSSKTKNN